VNITNGDSAAAIAQVRVARSTDLLSDILEFYCDVLGLPMVASFLDHEGYDGVMIGVPDRRFHLEFTHKASGSPAPPPHAESLLVLYVPDPGEFERLLDRLRRRGHHQAALENPYWERNGARAYRDPDGWLVVLMPSDGI
jgi:catechol 2,3-dioxygenase-like lactoylglutathione lyase family enzyme